MNIRKISAIIMPLVLIGYVGSETWLKLHHSSLCSATGCKMAGELLRFNGIYLDFLGIIAGLAMFVTALLWLKHELFKPLFFVTLFSAIAFETVMIGFQAFSNPQMCHFCLGVYGLLLLTAFLTNIDYFVYALAPITAIFIALSTLSIPQNIPMVKNDGIYLIHSNKCPHCKKVKRYFAEHNISYYPISVTNPNARSLATTLNIREIPIAIIKKGQKIEILRGDRDIIEKFSHKESKTEEKNSAPLKETDLYSNPDEGGCSISPFEESSCEKGANP